MFVSLKWKAVFFLSMVLVLITLAWVGQSVFQTITDFKVERKTVQLQHQQILNQLLSDNFLKLSQFAQLVAEQPMIRQSQSTEAEQISRQLEAQWLSLNINFGLDYLAIFDDRHQELGFAFSSELFSDLDHLKTQLGERVARAAEFGPQTLIFCDVGCMQIIVEPIVFDSGRQGYMVMGQNMADIVRSYHEFSHSDLSVLLKQDPESAMGDAQRYLPHWQLETWAISQSEKKLPLLKAYSQQHELAERDDNVWFDTNHLRYRFSPLSVIGHDVIGRPVFFIDINDESAAQQQLISSIFNGIATGCFGLFFSEAVLIFIMMGPLRRLGSIVAALKLLPEHRYETASATVQRKSGFIKDELTTLEDSTVYVAKALSQLHCDVQRKNIELNEQILVLSRSRSFLTRLFDSSHLYLLTQNMSFQLITSNRLFNGLVADETSNFLQLFSDDTDKEQFECQIQALVVGREELIQQELEMLDQQQKPHYISWTHTLVENEQGQRVILSVGTDLTYRKKAENALQWLANNDSLTGIGNRRAFNEHLHYLLSTNTEGALVFIDVNRFKQINDLYGHVVGDQVLINIANCLKRHTRATDFISRLAGDEFTIILTRVSPVTVVPVLEKLSQQLMGSLELEDKRVIEYSVSLGVSFFPQHGNNEQSLIMHADRAMYRAKRKGLGRWYIYDPTDDNLSSLKKDNELISLIKRALNQDLFTLVFQPIMSLTKESISHYEVLLRMNDDQGEPISPAEFITVAERVGLIRAIDIWVLEHATALLAQELPLQSGLKFAINVSAPSLQDSSFPQTVLDCLASHGVSAEHLIIELTETAYIDNFEQVLHNLKYLSNAGIAIALDDFGVGFSSFNYLKRMPLTYVKLDGSYIRQLADNLDNQIFVESLSNMVNAFGMKTIAEFVEDESTLSMLRGLGVSYAQGYHIGKPDTSFITKAITTKS